MASGYNIPPGEGYTPIRTKTDVREARIEGLTQAVRDVGSRMAQRLRPATIGSEVFEYLTGAFFIQGRNEIANAIFHDATAYYPGPGAGVSPAHSPQEPTVSVHGPATPVATAQADSASLDAYLSGDYSPARPDHNSLYLGPASGGVHGPAASPSDGHATYSMTNYRPSSRDSYDAELDVLASRGRGQEIELER